MRWVVTGACVFLAVACGGKDTELPPNPAIGGAGGAGGATSSSTSTTATTGGGGIGGVIETPRGGAPPIPPLVEESLGEVAYGAAVTAEIPDNTLGFTAVTSIASTQDLALVFSLTAPDAAPLIDQAAIAGTGFVFGFYGMTSAAVPMTDDPQAMPLMTGPWSIVPLSTDQTPTEVSVWRRQTLDGAFHGGLVDVNVFIVADAVTQSYASGVIAETFDDFAGLGMGTISFFTLPSTYAVLDESTYFTVFEQTAGAPGKPALNVIYTHEIASGALGYSPSAPAMPLIHGTLRSGIAMKPTSPHTDALVLRHELGHFAGLGHTSEQDVGIGDRLSDTPFCDDVLTQGLSCPDVDYLMFPFAMPNGPSLLSPQQATVIQASPIYRGAVEPNGGFAEPLPQQEAFLRPAPADHRPTTRREHPRAWRDGHAPGLVRVASAHWCQHHAPGASPPDGSALLQLHADENALWDLAADPRAPGYVRGRALGGAAADALDEGELSRLAVIAGDDREPRALRAAALRALARTARPLPMVKDAILKRLRARLR